MGEFLEIAKVFVSPAEKLIDCVSGAIGKVYEPRYLKKIADAKVYEIEQVANAAKSLIDIPISYQNGDVSVDTSQFEELVKRAGNRLGYQELRKQANIESVIGKSYKMLSESSDSIDNTPVDDDWLIRFFNSVEDISNEDMQELWAKILAGEIKRPSSFSLRTLNTMRNLSVDEARLFQKICSVVVCSDDYFVPGDLDFLKDWGITYDDIIKMDECGLVNSSGLIAMEKEVRMDYSIFANNNEIAILVRTKDGTERKTNLAEFPLTESGREIYNLVDTKASNDYLMKYARLVASQERVDVSARRIARTDGKTYDIEGEELLI